MERLKGKKQIEQLFVSGRSIGAFPLRLVYIETEIINKVGVSVSKKHFKKISYAPKFTVYILF